jgi:hypothetical protein
MQLPDPQMVLPRYKSLDCQYLTCLAPSLLVQIEAGVALELTSSDEKLLLEETNHYQTDKKASKHMLQFQLYPEEPVKYYTEIQEGYK